MSGTLCWICCDDVEEGSLQDHLGRAFCTTCLEEMPPEELERLDVAVRMEEEGLL